MVWEQKPLVSAGVLLKKKFVRACLNAIGPKTYSLSQTLYKMAEG